MRTPDYEITLANGPVLVEVKQLDANDEDREWVATWRAGKVATRFVNMGRARLSIDEAVRQLRPHAKEKKPAIVVLYDTIGMTGYLDPYSISFCLYGPEKVHFHVPENPADDVVCTGMSRGGKSVATKNQNTTLSAVAVISPSVSEGQLHLDVFHNIHAAIPLDPAACDNVGFRQFHFVQRTPASMPEWVEWKGAN